MTCVSGLHAKSLCGCVDVHMEMGWGPYWRHRWWQMSSNNVS